MGGNTIIYKTIYVYDLDGNYISQHESVPNAAAAASLNSKLPYESLSGMINGCLRGKAIRCENRRYTYKPYQKYPLPNNYYVKPIKYIYSLYKYDVSGKFIGDFFYSYKDKKLAIQLNQQLRLGRSFYKNHFYLKEKYEQIPNELYNKLINKKGYPFQKYDINGYYIETIPSNTNDKIEKQNRNIWNTYKRSLGFYYLKEKYDKIPEDIFNKIKYTEGFKKSDDSYIKLMPIYKYGLDGKLIEELFNWDSKRIYFGTKRQNGDGTFMRYKGHYYLKEKYNQIPENIFNKIKYSNTQLLKNINKWKHYKHVS